MPHKLLPSVQARTNNMLACLAVCVCLAAAVLLIYANTLDNPFVFDDRPYIVNDTAVHMNELSWPALKKAGIDGRPRHRFLPNMSFALNYYFGGHSVPGYHAVNIVIHLLAGVFLFFLIKTTISQTAIPPSAGFPRFSESNESRKSALIAFLTAFMWLAHPINTESVTYLVQRMTSMAGMFFIASLLFYALARANMQNHRSLFKTAALFAASLLSGLCALASKENTATLPLIILLYEWFFFQDLKLRITKHRMVCVGTAVILFLVIAWLFLGGPPMERIIGSYTRRDFTLVERVLTEFRVIVYYISLFFYPSPSRLNLDHDYPLSQTMLTPGTTLLSFVALSGLLIGSIYMARRHRLPAFCILWFLVSLSIESSIIGIEIIFEHRTYIPFMMPCFLMVLTIYRYIKPVKFSIGLLIAAGLLFSLWTVQRNAIWQSPVAFWSDTATKSPKDARPINNLGNAYRHAGNLDDALNCFQAAIRLDPGYEKPYNNMANIYVRQGKLELAIRYYEKAIVRKPDYRHAKMNLERVKRFKSSHDETITDKGKNMPELSRLYIRKADQFRAEGDLKAAISKYRDALALNPSDTKARYRLAIAYALNDNPDQSIQHFQKILESEPNNHRVYYNIACIHARQHKISKALDWLKQAIDHGYKNWHQINSDPDLEEVRQTSAFKALMDALGRASR